MTRIKALPGLTGSDTVARAYSIGSSFDICSMPTRERHQAANQRRSRNARKHSAHSIRRTIPRIRPIRVALLRRRFIVNGTRQTGI